MPQIPAPPWDNPSAYRAAPEQPLPSDSEVDPDGPIITWRWQRSSAEQTLRGRSVTIDADLVAPASLDRHPHDYVRVGQSYIQAFAVLAVPRQLHPGTFGRLSRLPGVHVVLVNNPVPRQLAKDRLADLARAMGVAIHQAGAEGADETLALRDLRRHMTALAEEQSAHHLFGLYCTVAGADLSELQTRTRAWLDACVDAQFHVTRCDFQHWEGVLTTAPLGHDHLRYLHETDTPTLARLLPSTPTPLQRGQGVPILYGFRVDGMGQGGNSGAPVLLDRFTLASQHQAKCASIGGGKTYQQCLELLQRFAHGNCAICVIDPKNQEYRRLIEEVLGGTYLVLSERSPVRLNPLTLPTGDPALIRRLAALDLDVRASRAALIKQIAVTEAIARGQPLSPRAETQLEEAIIGCYEAKGMTADPATFHTDAPTLGDVLALVRARHAETALLELMELFTSGTLGRLINAPGTLPLAIPPSTLRSDVGVLGIDVSAFIQGNDATLQRVLPVLIANYCITVAMNNAGTRPIELVIDEAWSLLATEAGSSILEVLARVGRSLGIAVTAITQQIYEFLYRRSGDTVVPNAAGRAFLANCETVLLLRQMRAARAGQGADENPIVQAAQYFGLKPGEITWLSRCQRDPNGDGATGLLLVGREPIPLHIPRAPEPLHTWIMHASVGSQTGRETSDGS